MSHFARRAGGGALVTGTGGDEILSPYGFRRRRFRDIARVRPRRRAARSAAYNALPAGARHRIDRRRTPAPAVPWLRPEGERLLARAWWDSFTFEPTWRRGLLGMLDSRGYEVTRAVIGTFVRDEGVALFEPFYEPEFVRAFAEFSPRMGFATRDAALESLFRELLPPRVLHRGTKAVFNEVLTGPRVREFAHTWDGTGLDDRIVDPEILRATWSEPAPDVRSIPSLHHAWLLGQ
jgi:asparagine synthase (glutamine-hydrolysing)